MRKKGFTLAEVLITLSIIGVVAALTIPALTRNFEKTQCRNAFKSVFSTLSQAHKMVAADHGGSIKGVFTNQWDLFDESKTDDYTAYLKHTKKCNSATDDGCWHAAGAWKYMNGNLAPAPAMGEPGLILNNGMLLVNYSTNLSTCDMGSNGDVCWDGYIDVNGFKGPNEMGKDIFVVRFRESDAMPFGRGSEATDYPCDYSNTTTKGWSCAYKVIMNQDY